jgi:hypothetical protein
VIEYAEKNDKTGTFILADFEKAFESISYKYVFKT